MDGQVEEVLWRAGDEPRRAARDDPRRRVARSRDGRLKAGRYSGAGRATTGGDERWKTGRGGGSGRAATAALDGLRRRRWQETGDDDGAGWAATTALDGDGGATGRNRGAGGRAEEPPAEKKLDRGGLD